MSPRKSKSEENRTRRVYLDDLKKEAVQMFLDGHSTSSIASRLGLSSPNLIYQWKVLFAPKKATPSVTDERVRELKAELDRVRRERDILKKALTIFSQKE